MIEAVAIFLARHCRLFTFLVLLSLVIPVTQLPKCRVNNSVEMWLSPDQPALNSYREFLGRYGSEQVIVLATYWPDPLAGDALRQQVSLANKVKEIPAVQSVFDFGTLASSVESSQKSLSDAIKSELSLSKIVQDLRFSGSFEGNEFLIDTDINSFPAIANEIYTTMKLLGITREDIYTVYGNINQAYAVSSGEFTRFCASISNKSYANAAFTAVLFGLYSEMSISFNTLVDEFSRLDIDNYARFLGYGRPDWRNYLKREPLFKNFILGPDGHTVGMVITIDDSRPASETVASIYDTIHFLACYRTLRPKHILARDAFIETLDQTGRSITWTSIIAASGFSILLLAPFKPLQYFGLLGTVTMLTAWL